MKLLTWKFMPQLNYHNPRKVRSAGFVLQIWSFLSEAPLTLWSKICRRQEQRGSSSSLRVTCSAWVAPQRNSTVLHSERQEQMASE